MAQFPPVVPIARFGRIWLYIAYSTSYFFHVDKTAAICGKLVGLFLKKPPPFRNRRGGNNPRKMKGVAAELTGGGVLLLPLLCFTPADRQTEEKEAERYLSEVVFLLCSVAAWKGPRLAESRCSPLKNVFPLLHLKKSRVTSSW